MPKHIPVTLAVLAFLALGIGLIATSHGFMEMDEVTHYLQARYAILHPCLYASIWARPFFVLLYTLPAQLPFALARVFTLLLATLVGLIAYRLARLKGIPWPSLAFVFTVFQPFFIRETYTVMTETTMALLLAASLLCWETHRKDLSCLLISLSPLARPEGFLLGPLWFLFVWLNSKAPVPARLKRTLMLLVGLCLWVLMSWLACGDPFWFVRNFPWVHPGSLGRGSFWSYTLRLPVVASWPILVLSILGLFAIRRFKLWRTYLLAGFILLLHSIFWSRGMFGTGGYLRYLVLISAFLGLGAAAGWTLILNLSSGLFISILNIPKFRIPIPKLVFAVLFLFLIVWTYVLTLRTFPIPLPSERPEARIFRSMQAFLNSRTLEPSNPRNLVYCSDFQYYLLTGRDPWDLGMTNREYLQFVKHDELQLKGLFEALPKGTYVLYDKEWMTGWAGFRPEELTRLGYVPVSGQPSGDVGNGNLIRLYIKPTL